MNLFWYTVNQHMNQFALCFKLDKHGRRCERHHMQILDKKLQREFESGHGKLEITLAAKLNYHGCFRV